MSSVTQIKHTLEDMWRNLLMTQRFEPYQNDFFTAEMELYQNYFFKAEMAPYSIYFITGLYKTKSSILSIYVCLVDKTGFEKAGSLKGFHLKGIHLETVQMH